MADLRYDGPESQAYVDPKLVTNLTRYYDTCGAYVAFKMTIFRQCQGT